MTSPSQPSDNTPNAFDLLRQHQQAPSESAPRRTPDALEFEFIMSQLNTLPLWVKQALYLQFGRELEKAFTLLNIGEQSDEDILQFHIPQVTALGNAAAKQRDGQFSDELILLLKLAQQGKNVMNLCAAAQWSLAQTCQLMMEAIDKQLMLPPQSTKSYGSMAYLSGRIRLGEYLVQIGRITLEQLDEALRAQHYISEVLGEKAKLADILINLGTIKKRECESILFLKEESKKTFSRNAFNLSGNS
jgi:hypothetical protein